MTTYTVISPSGADVERGLSVEDAAERVLTYDGAAYELRPTDPRNDVGGETLFELWTRRANGPWNCAIAVGSAYARDAAGAWPAIAAQVVRHCNGWRHAPTVRTDADYDRTLAEHDAEEASAHDDSDPRALYLVREGEAVTVDPQAAATWRDDGAGGVTGEDIHRWVAADPGGAGWVLAWARSEEEARHLARQCDAGEIAPDNVAVGGVTVGALVGRRSDGR